MVQVSAARGWEFEVDRGPDWLIVRPRRLDRASKDSPSLAEQVWALLERSLTRRLVLELGDVDPLDETLVGELLQLHQRIVVSEGTMRVCGLSPQNERLLHKHSPAVHITNHCDREAAVKGEIRPRHPR